jgi:hypothetical protein
MMLSILDENSVRVETPIAKPAWLPHVLLIYGFWLPAGLLSLPNDLKKNPLSTSKTVRPEATRAWIIETPNTRLRMMGIIAAKPTIGSHFLREEIFKFDCSLWRSIYYLLIILIRRALDYIWHLCAWFCYYQPHFTLDVNVPLFPLSDTNFSVPGPQCPESLMSDGVSLSHISSKASNPFKERLSDEAWILVMIPQLNHIFHDRYSIQQRTFPYQRIQKNLFSRSWFLHLLGRKRLPFTRFLMQFLLQTISE